MNRLLVYIIVLTVLLLSSSFLTVDVYISGKIYKATSKSNLPLRGIKIFVKYKNKIIAEATTDKFGHYEIVITVGLSDGLKDTYDFYVTSANIDTCFIKSFRQFKSEEIMWNIKLPISCKKKAAAFSKKAVLVVVPDLIRSAP